MANGIGRRTAAAGTKIRVLVPPSPYGYSLLAKFVYTTAATAHTMTILRPIGQTTAASVAGAGVAAFTLTGDPGPATNLLAAGDLVAIRETDGVTRLYVVLTYSGGTLTLTTNLTAGVAVGSKVWDFGVEADTDPYTGAAHEVFPLAGGTVTTTREATTGLIGTHLPDQPLLLSVDNIANAGSLDYATWGNSTGGVSGRPLLSSSDAGDVAVM